MESNTKKMLLVQLFSNGDCLYATAIARQIKQDFPGCSLTWAIAGFCSDIIANNPYVNEILEINDVKKNDVVAFRKLKRRFANEKREGKWDEVFVTTNMDSNQALYDGTIRGMVFRAYPFTVNVPVQPVLQLTEQEKNDVADFAEKYKLPQFKNVILWEYAPQSGQSILDLEFVMRLAKRITALPSTCIILSSANSFSSTETIIDASSISIRQNAALTHFCSLLIGCSSGITWISTSSAAKSLPMLQLLNPKAFFLNPPSVDFQRYGITTENLIEIINLDEQVIFNCLKTIIEKNFPTAKKSYNQVLPVQFNTTRKIVYNLLCYLQFGAIVKHFKIITSIYGKHPLFLKQFMLGIMGFPFKLISNVYRKKILSQR